RFAVFTATVQGRVLSSNRTLEVVPLNMQAAAIHHRQWLHGNQELMSPPLLHTILGFLTAVLRII
ncbi:hypothetical protein, partial [Mycobacterium tuberculosis]